MHVALEFLALAAARAVAVQQSMHTELLKTLAVVVQSLATEPQRRGQTLLVDPLLHQLHHQQPTRSLVAQIHPLAQTAAM
jgi:hypothetical protein